MHSIQMELERKRVHNIVQTKDQSTSQIIETLNKLLKTITITENAM